MVRRTTAREKLKSDRQVIRAIQSHSIETNTDLDLNSSVELVFKTDYLPLDRLAGKGQVDRIKVNTINPDAEEKLASQERQARLQGARAADTARNSGLDADLNPKPSPQETPTKSGSASPPNSQPAAKVPSKSPVVAGGSGNAASKQ